MLVTMCLSLTGALIELPSKFNLKSNYESLLLSILPGMWSEWETVKGTVDRMFYGDMELGQAVQFLNLLYRCSMCVWEPG